MGTITSMDSAMAAVTMLSQLIATVLVVRCNECGKSFSEALQWGTVAAVTAAFIPFLRFIFYWGSKRQIGNRLSSTGILVVYYAAFISFLPLYAGWNCYNPMDRLWITAYVVLTACCVIALTGAQLVSEFVVMFVYPLAHVIAKTDGLLYWRIGLMILAVSLVIPMALRETHFMDLKRAEDLRKKEAGEIKKRQESMISINVD